MKIIECVIVRLLPVLASMIQFSAYFDWSNKIFRQILLNKHDRHVQIVNLNIDISTNALKFGFAFTG